MAKTRALELTARFSGRFILAMGQATELRMIASAITKRARFNTLEHVLVGKVRTLFRNMF